ncbi:acyl-CoA-binding domain-containing protein 4 isoform X2 [Paroedura picta]|uniref:acyl-CoA-binding domain-containing protein 4 isoform X2 n=1 Tax=Paroedura picta TaxID=143630 RepID=UPI0040569EFB
MEEPDYQKQFEAAVRVIQGLPRNGGAYRPSYEEMLRFYSYYKQATVGQCQISRPGFWDPIGRYKWDAWKRLGKMTKKEAMVAYIQEMKKSAQKVIDTVPLEEASEDMFDYFRPLYELIDDMPRPPESFFKKKSVPDSSPLTEAGIFRGGTWQGPGPAEEGVKGPQGTSDSESEVFCDSLEHVELDQVRRLSAEEGSPVNGPHKIQTGETREHQPPMRGPLTARGEELHGSGPQTDPAEEDLGSSRTATEETAARASIWREVDAHMRSTIRSLEADLKEVRRRLSYLETLAASQDPPHPPAHLTPPTFFFLLVWPLVIQWLLWRLQSWKR